KRKEFLHRPPDTFRPQVVVNQEHPSGTDSRIEKFQSVLGRLVEIDVQVHKREALVCNRTAGRRKQSPVDVDTSKLRKIRFYRLKRGRILSGSKKRVELIGGGQSFEGVKK